MSKFCDCTPVGNRYMCSSCGLPSTHGTKRRCIKKQKRIRVRKRAGIKSTSYFLHQIILKKTGECIRPGCGCESMMRQMNEWGPDGCREHIEEIVDEMQSEGKERGWWNKIKASIPIVSRAVMKDWVREAIFRAEKEVENANHNEIW